MAVVEFRSGTDAGAGRVEDQVPALLAEPDLAGPDDFKISTELADRQRLSRR
jgi:hypothetical protein